LKSDYLVFGSVLQQDILCKISKWLKYLGESCKEAWNT